jgi:hypothetical protein
MHEGIRAAITLRRSIVAERAWRCDDCEQRRRPAGGEIRQLRRDALHEDALGSIVTS